MLAGPPTRLLALLAAAALAAALLGGCFQDVPVGDASGGATSTNTTSSTSSATGTTTATTSTATSTTSTASTTTDSSGGESSGACEPIFWYLDADGDTFGDPESGVEACEAPPDHVANDLDCDDDAAGVSPDADELCDGIDNDCDEAIDEHSPANLECGGCTMVAAGRSIYHLCPDPRVWDAGRALCQDRGGDLVILADPGEDAIVGEIVAGSMTKWWLGLSDQALEGSFVWVDGAPLDPRVAAWQAGEPNNLNEEDCAERYAAGPWNDAKCALASPVLCESPAP